MFVPANWTTHHLEAPADDDAEQSANTEIIRLLSSLKTTSPGENFFKVCVKKSLVEERVLESIHVDCLSVDSKYSYGGGAYLTCCTCRSLYFPLLSSIPIKAFFLILNLLLSFLSRPELTFCYSIESLYGKWRIHTIDTAAAQVTNGVEHWLRVVGGNEKEKCVTRPPTGGF